MANLTNVKIKDGFQSLLTTSETTSDPTTGTLQNGKGSAITTITIPTVVGNLTGNADTATSATSATTAGTVTTAAQPAITSVGTLTDLNVVGSGDTLPSRRYNNTLREFANRITKAQGNTHTITIAFESQSSQWSGAVVEVLFTAGWTDAGNTFAGRAIYALSTFNSMTNLAEIQDIGSGVSFAGAISGMNLIITATTTASGGQEPNRIGAYVKVVTSNPNVSASPTTMTLA